MQPSCFLNTARLRKEIATKEASITRRFTIQINKLKSDLKKSVQSNLEIKRDTKIDQAESDGVRDLQIKFVQFIMENHSIHPNSRKFPQEILDICFSLYHLCPQSHRLLRNILPVPSRQTIDRHFQSQMEMYKYQLTEVGHIPDLLKMWRESNHADDIQIDIILGLDACAFDRISNTGKKYGFCYFVQPLCPKYKCFPVHLLPHVDGKAKSLHVATREQIIRILFEHNFHVIGCATDGDDTFNACNKESFNLNTKNALINGIDQTIRTCPVLSNHSFGDMMHIMKNARTRLFKGKISFNREKVTLTADINVMRESLQLGSTLSDDSSTGAMRDCYVLKLFTLHNVVKLLEENHVGEAYYILPYAFWLEGVVHKGLSRISRIKSIENAFTLFSGHYQESCSAKKTKGITTNCTQNTEYLVFASDALLIRAMNATFLTVFAIHTYPEVCLDRIGTHVLENYFGCIRSACYYTNSWENILSSSVTALIIHDINLKYHLQYHIQGRENVAGVKIDGRKDDNDLIDLVYQLTPEEYAATLFANMGLRTIYSNLLITIELPLIDSIYEELHYNSHELASCEFKVYEPGPVTSFGIKARCMLPTKSLITHQLDDAKKKSDHVMSLLGEMECSTDPKLSADEKSSMINDINQYIDSLGERAQSLINRAEQDETLRCQINELENEEIAILNSPTSEEGEHRHLEIKHTYANMNENIDSIQDGRIIEDLSFFASVHDQMNSQFRHFLHSQDSPTPTHTPLRNIHNVFFPRPLFPETIFPDSIQFQDSDESDFTDD